MAVLASASKETMQAIANKNYALDRLILEVNEELEKAGAARASQVFNLGCSLGLLPVIIFVLLAFFISGNNWTATIITTILLLLAWIGLTYLVAHISKSRSMERMYKDYLAERISRELRELHLSQNQFNQTATEILPKSAPLRAFLPLQFSTVPSI